jgi:uncharacterized secreted protein with C-terminal beta-propeller domain
MQLRVDLIGLTAVVGLVVLGLWQQSSPSVQADERASLPSANQPPQLPNEAQVMRVKLLRAQALLQALTLEDFKSIQENAESLVRISKATEFLRAYKTEEYEFQARVFQKAAETLAAKAKEKNIDGATLAYVDMTVSCVACHNHFRGRKRD